MGTSAQPVRTWATRLLLAFVLVSIGFAVGKETALRAQRRVAAAATVADSAKPTEPNTATPQLIVYFMHPTIRCVTCNSIERRTRQTIAADFAAELAAGRIVMKESNFDEDSTLANRYEVPSSTVVLVRRKNDKELGFKRLDQVWTMIEKSPEDFAEFIRTEVVEQLAKGGA